MLVVYQLGRTCLNFVIRKTKLGFYGAVSPEDREGSLRLRSILNSPGSLKNSVFDKYMPYLELFSKAAFIVGILFAAAVPLITDMTYVNYCSGSDIGACSAADVFARRPQPRGRVRSLY